MLIMLANVGIIGALASIPASLLVGSSSAEEESPTTAPAPTTEQELANIKIELAALRQLMEQMVVEKKQRPTMIDPQAGVPNFTNRGLQVIIYVVDICSQRS